VLALLAACTSKHAGIHDAGADATTPARDGPATRDGLAERAGPVPDLRPTSGDAPTPSATGGLPFGWTSSVPIGVPGWQGTQTPLCDVHQGLGFGDTAGVWADARGVFVLGTTDCVYVDRVLAGCPNDGEGHMTAVLEQNDGSGWRLLWEDTYLPYVELAGIPDGPLLYTGPGCGLIQIDPASGVETCWLELEGEPWIPQPTFVVSPAVAYQADNRFATETGRFLQYRAGTWTLAIAQQPEAINAIWGSESLAFLAGDYQLYTWSSAAPAALQPMPNAPSARYTAAWGFADNDVWFGNSAGQLVHYDGTGFAVLQVSAPERRGIVGLWGQGDQLYFRTQTEFGRVVGGRAQTLLTAPRDENATVSGMWGTSPHDVFLAIEGALDSSMSPCRHNSMFWFDGQTFHQF
jgi:hypothetical protein